MSKSDPSFRLTSANCASHGTSPATADADALSAAIPAQDAHPASKKAETRNPRYPILAMIGQTEKRGNANDTDSARSDEDLLAAGGHEPVAPARKVSPDQLVPRYVLGLPKTGLARERQSVFGAEIA